MCACCATASTVLDRLGTAGGDWVLQHISEYLVRWTHAWADLARNAADMLVISRIIRTYSAYGEKVPSECSKLARRASPATHRSSCVAVGVCGPTQRRRFTSEVVCLSTAGESPIGGMAGWRSASPRLARPPPPHCSLCALWCVLCLANAGPPPDGAEEGGEAGGGGGTPAAAAPAKSAPACLGRGGGCQSAPGVCGRRGTVPKSDSARAGGRRGVPGVTKKSLFSD